MLNPPCPAAWAPVQITEEQRVKAELLQQIETLRGRISDQRQQMGGLNNSKEQEAKVRAREGGEAGDPAPGFLAAPGVVARCAPF